MVIIVIFLSKNNAVCSTEERLLEGINLFKTETRPWDHSIRVEEDI